MRPFLSILIIMIASLSLLAEEDYDDLVLKRQTEFGFSEKPSLKRINANQIEIRFTAKSFSDVTVSIQNSDGQIVRHLASGLLGDNAPKPFQIKSLSQVIQWDGKDDRGEYLNLNDGYVLKVSSGLKAQFEKEVFNSHKRKLSEDTSIMCAQPEGVYVYEGGVAMDFVRLYNHDGQYIRTVYPFPANKIEGFKSLQFRVNKDGSKIPMKSNFLQNTFLTSGNNGYGGLQTFDEKNNRYLSGDGKPEEKSLAHYGMAGRGAQALSVRNGVVALTNIRLNRFTSDGGYLHPGLTGPIVAFEDLISTRGKKETEFKPAKSSALSPDGKTLYLTGYIYTSRFENGQGTVFNDGYHAKHCVVKVDLTNDQEMKVFKGDPDKAGNTNELFNIPTDVEVDSKGFVYIADFFNNRVQIYQSNGEFANSFKANQPAQITIDEKRDCLYVVSHIIWNKYKEAQAIEYKNKITVFGPLSKPVKMKEYELEIDAWHKWHRIYRGNGYPAKVEIDIFGEKPVVWVSEKVGINDGRDFSGPKTNDRKNIRLYTMLENDLVLKSDWHKDVLSENKFYHFPELNRQRIYFNPKNEKLYLAEGNTFLGKGFSVILEIDPKSGNNKLINLPFDAEDMAFDYVGNLYLRSINSLMRFDIDSMKEVPWDYGVEKKKVSTSGSGDKKETDAFSAINLPATGHWHQGGMSLNPNGDLIVTCGVEVLGQHLTVNNEVPSSFNPKVFPGRNFSGRGGAPTIHIWNKHGQVVKNDVLPGLSGNTYGVWLDNDRNSYVIAAATKMYNGEKHYNDLSGALIKIPYSSAAKILSMTDKGSKYIGIKMPLEKKPEGEHQLESSSQQKAWVTGVDWIVGGFGWSGKNAGIGCSCWNTRSAFDYFNRSFAVELHRYSIGVVDSGGNLIIRIGQYGNADSLGPKSNQSLGGDEVGLMHGAFVATQSDKKVFIADPGNARIIAVTLDYHVNETIDLSVGMK